ncbi:MAG TPA: M15 family metallopeptidase [Chthoniobacterales bacterium]
MRNFFARTIILLLLATGGTRAAFAQENVPLVDIRTVDPTIVIDLRYAGPHNIAGHPIYVYGTRPLVRPEVAQRLRIAQKFLHRYNYCLKIWDAYRPRYAQIELWKASRNNDFVADPNAGAGSLHSWGLAVDATLTDTWHRPVAMPTDFDDFRPAAMWKYAGTDPSIRAHLYTLQVAMRDAGFYGLPAEWWHFTADDWQKFLPPDEAKRALQLMGQSPEEKL